MKHVDNKVIYCGIDVSKLTLDVDYQENAYVLSNGITGFKKLLKTIDPNTHCVMEATGPYYLKLAVYLYQYNVKVSVVNPLIIKRFSQMRMIRAKTDKADARLITLYAAKESPALWTPPKSILIEVQQEQTIIEGLQKQSRMLKNQFSAIGVQPVKSRNAISVLKYLIKELEKQINILEQISLDKVEKHFKNEMKLLTSIPGIGVKTAMTLLVATNGFTKFPTAKQLVSYAGLCPRIYQSGSSVKGKGHITKMGGSRIRAMLYMGACSAMRYNLSCKALYLRLLEKGKAKKVALIAVASKLLRQAFAVVTQNKMFNQTEYYSELNTSLT